MLEVDNCHFLMDPQGLLVGQINGKCGNWNTRIHALEQPGQAAVRVTSMLPARIPEARHAEMLEFLNRLNANFALGYFFMIHGEGTVCFYTSVDLMDGQLTQEMLRKIFFTNLNTVDSHFPAIMSLAYGHMSANEAYQAFDDKTKSAPSARKSDITLQ